ncbi:NADH dehydrogenase [ubiquinone] 1 beta subcomplex subunit 8, mitochondrial [Cephus cinctus]|uniref:NADH dehydrogenase [ubiquinone] 1 beta subcomplex subunit 8, mitochondrial n=1 Tax=Cephus cinctus TaxID=211228 RepID=A0AAJ7FQV6_CEPCN|nr:NADH dehydrogenase [ubiquinone] 1 beta subcomplex subunit 8, mitochondrial [Cephus cinctus]
MASLVKFGRLSSQLTPRKTGYLYVIVRNFKNADWKPGPYPTTEEERKKAAAKYNLHPLEYEPYPDDDGLGSGDYPKLPDKGVEFNDPYYPYDFPALKRNFNEAVHREINMLGEDRWGAGRKTQYPIWFYYAASLGVIGTFMAIFFWTRDNKIYRPVLEKQYPTPGVTHYTFEPAR